VDRTSPFGWPANASTRVRRVFEASGEMPVSAEGWHRDRPVPPVSDRNSLDPVVADLISRTRRDAR